MELSETNISNSELTDSELKKTEVNEVLELDLYKENHGPNMNNSDKQIEDIAKALTSGTRRSILRLIQKTNEAMDVSNIASILNMTEANISAQIKKLQEAGLIYCDYCSGNHGVRKISKVKFNKVIINI
ncbi:MAG: helix-turn-helix transcriptional regulator [Candidatus Lokiarchaeota archaeon]|nr:helix-turn-helix transcriptional regulator [Candidatus Lokiarchaeota archaeon]